jgi:protein-S-isoprenylcysteine O-methyltransferase Ste14
MADSVWYDITTMKYTNLLVFLQILFLFLFLISGSLIAKNFYLQIVELGALVLIVWAGSIMMKHSKIRVAPEPAQNARLLETGPYRYIRNPMYFSGLSFMGALILDHFTILRLTIAILITIVLLKKISIEEKLLTEKFKGYTAYKSRTKRLIPFIY